MEKQISELHRQLLQLKLSLLQTEIGKTVDAIAVEMRIDIKNEKWDLSPDFSKFIRRIDNGGGLCAAAGTSPSQLAIKL
jgi:hypothetical protein